MRESVGGSAEILGKKEFHNHVEELVEVAPITGQPVSILFADIDRFKDINDELGHDQGDIVIEDIKGLVVLAASGLRSAREIKKGAMQPADFVAVDTEPGEIVEEGAKPGHVGGDEFAIGAVTDEAGIEAIDGRLRVLFDEWLNRPENARLKALEIGMSIGKATLRHGMTSSDLFKEADQAMYNNKLEQLPPLTESQMAALREIMQRLNEEGLRPRDLLKYKKRLELLGNV